MTRRRDTLKQAARLATVLIGTGFALEGVFLKPQYGIPLLIAAFTWLSIHVQENDERRATALEREKRVLAAFGTSEKELRSLFGLSEEQITALLEEPKARADFGAHLEKVLKRYSALPHEAER